MQSLNENLFQKIETEKMTQIIGGALTYNPTYYTNGPKKGKVETDTPMEDSIQ